MDETRRLWTDQWDNPTFKRELTSYLDQNAGAMARVDKIVCFGLGDWSVQSQSYSYIQHLAALHIRSTLARIQDTPLTTFKVYAQDPAYCTTAEASLRKLDIEPVEHPSGFDLLDENTFVVSMYPTAPVRQMATGLLNHVGGPAGMLCNAIQNDGMYHVKGQWDPSSPWVMAYRDRCENWDPGRLQEEELADGKPFEGLELYR